MPGQECVLLVEKDMEVQAQIELAIADACGCKDVVVQCCAEVHMAANSLELGDYVAVVVEDSPAAFDGQETTTLPAGGALLCALALFATKTPLVVCHATRCGHCIRKLWPACEENERLVCMPKTQESPEQIGVLIKAAC